MSETIKLKQVERRLALCTAGNISRQNAAVLRALGYQTFFRYTKRTKGITDEPDLSHWRVGLSHEEFTDHLEVGADVGIVQFSDRESVPTEKNGEEAGDAAGWNAMELGYPKGGILWYDFEFDKIPVGATKEGNIKHLKRVYNALEAHGVEPGLYYGMNTLLSSDDLYWKLPFKHYWKSASAVPMVAVRGPQMVQLLTHTIMGIKFTVESPCIDGKGGIFGVATHG